MVLKNSLTKLPVFLVLSFLIINFSCKKKDKEEAPSACFNVSQYFIDVDGSVNFSNCSANYDRVEWDFGDGSSSTISGPTHVFEKRGYYTVTLSVFKGTQVNKTSDKVVVGQNLILPFSYTISPTLDTTKYFGVDYYVFLCKTSNLNSPLPYFLSDYSTFHWPYPSSKDMSKIYINKTGQITENSNFKLKLVVIGLSYDSNSNVKFNKIDSLYTDQFGTFTGQNLTKTVTLPSGKITYNVKPANTF